MSYKFNNDYSVPSGSSFFKASEHEGSIVVWWSDGTVEDVEKDFGSFPDTPVVPVVVASPMKSPQVFRKVEVLQQVLSKSMAPRGFGYGRLVKRGRAWVFADLEDEEVKALGAWFKLHTDDQGMYVAPEGGHANEDVEPF